MFCEECGEKNRNDRKFCTNCGAALRDYTKPKENLITPEEITEKQTKVAKTNKRTKVLITIGTILIIAGVICLVARFFL